MNLLSSALLLGCVAAVHSQVVFTECPPGWIKSDEHCYKFVTYPRLKLNDASNFCRTNGATLVSVNGLQENQFIIQWLDEFDGARDSWFTSGVFTKVPEGVRWLGDGTTGNLAGGFNDTYDKSTLNDGDVILYEFSGVQYAWSVWDLNKNSSFICEINLQDIYKIVEEKRDFDYGLNINNAELAPRGPSFISQPEKTTILVTDSSAAYLDCLADGLPKPEYTWWRGSPGSWTKLVTGEGSKYSTTGGRLTIDFPNTDNEGQYQCRAENEFGSIMSVPVPLSFGSLGEFSNVATADVEGEVSAGAVIQCPKITFNPAIRYQWYKIKNGMSLAFIRPEVQTHTFVSMSGKLYFSELAPSDAAEYFCTVALTSTDGKVGNYEGSSQSKVRTSLGFNLLVQTGVSSEYQPQIQDDFIKVYPGSPRRGQTISLECFAYGTAPLVYSWQRVDGKPMPLGVTFTDTKRIMTIPEVQIEDSGVYRCRVDSRRTSTSDSKDFTLTIQAMPYFSYKLTDQHVDVGARISWHCEARGVPTPTYTWYKNGQPITIGTGMKILGNTMVIENATKVRDNGMYQCAAENMHGVSYTSAQIRVLEFVPTFDKRPVDSSLSAAIGGNVTIVCDPEAAPTPTFSWLFNDRDLGLVQGGTGSSNIKMLLNGNLFIDNVGNNNQGKYTCKVTNPKGEAMSSGELRVFPDIVISQKPRNVEQLQNETASLQCRASAPPDLDVIYIWKFNEHIIDFAREIEYQIGAGVNPGNLFIRGVQYKNEGRYTCTVATGMDSASAYGLLTVRGPPGEVSGVMQVSDVGTDAAPIDPSIKSIRIYWTDGLIHGSPILAYTVEFRTNFNQQWRVHPDGSQIPVRDTISSAYPEKRTVLLTKLKPYAGHQFRVRAINRFGMGAPSTPTLVLQVEGEPPTVAPPAVRGGGGRVGDLQIQWSPLPLEDYNGPNLRYVVHWREKTTTQADNTRWDKSEPLLPESVCEDIPDIDKGLVAVCSFTKLVGREKYYMPYEARVMASNGYGAGVLSRIADVYSAMEMPTQTPSQVYSVGFNATAIEVHWTPVPNTRQNMKGKLTGYRINYWDRDTEQEDRARFNIIPVPPGSDNVDHGMIIGLTPGHWYVANVQAISSAGYGPKSEDYPQETANYAPALYPTEVHVYSIEGIGVRVTFRGISTNVGEEPLMGYKLSYWPSGENIRKAQEIDVGRSNYGTITNVTETTLYQLRIFGYSRGGIGKRSSPNVYFTVGDGQVAFNPETTDVMAGAGFIRVSALAVFVSLLISKLFTRLSQH